MEQALIIGTIPVSYERRSNYGFVGSGLFSPSFYDCEPPDLRFFNEKQMNIALNIGKREMTIFLLTHLMSWPLKLA